jgi:hypothetical protein
MNVLQKSPAARRVLVATIAALACVPAYAGKEVAPGTRASRPTLFYLDLQGHVMRIGSDGKDARSIVEQKSGGPDGIAIDAERGHVYWTNMGKVSENDGFIQRADLDGGNVTTVVPVGATFTPKQMKVDAVNGKLYWSDREGMRVMRSNLDGSSIETLVITGEGEADRKDPAKWCVGIAVDVAGGKVYWSQKGGDNAKQGTIKRANLEIPAGETAAKRSDIEVLFSGLPEPIDIDLDLKHHFIYWTDRGDNTVSRAPMQPKRGFASAARKDREILVTDLHEAIGIALDIERGQMYYTSLKGEIGTARLDGKNARAVRPDEGRLTGIALLE